MIPSFNLFSGLMMIFTASAGQRASSLNVTRALEEVMHSPPLSVDRQLEIADCVMNVDQAVFYLMSAGLLLMDQSHHAKINQILLLVQDALPPSPPSSRR